MHELARISIEQLDHVTGGVIINTRPGSGAIKLNTQGSVNEPLAFPDLGPKLNAQGSVNEPLAFPNLGPIKLNAQGSVNEPLFVPFRRSRSRSR